MSTEADDQARAEMFAGQHFEAVHLSMEPLSAEACDDRDVIIRMAIAFLGRSSEQLHVEMTSPQRLEAVLECMEKSKEVEEWLRQTADFLCTAHLRMTCVASKTLLEHPEWQSLTGSRPRLRPVKSCPPGSPRPGDGVRTAPPPW